MTIRGGGLYCFCSWTSVPTADFTLDTQPVGLGPTGLAALALGMGFSSANISWVSRPWDGVTASQPGSYLTPRTHDELSKSFLQGATVLWERQTNKDIIT